MGFIHIQAKLQELLPDYAIDWTGAGWLLRKDIPDAKEEKKMMVGIHELGVFLYELKDGSLATVDYFNNFDHENHEFKYESIWLIDEEGNYDLDFLPTYIHADTFSELLADWEKYTKWLHSEI